MMKVSDPIIFGHVVRVFFSDLFNKHGKIFKEIGVDVNNGFGDLITNLDKLPTSKFIRVHKSYVVSIEHIKAIQKSKILVADMRIPVGETYKDTVMKRLGV